MPVNIKTQAAALEKIAVHLCRINGIPLRHNAAGRPVFQRAVLAHARRLMLDMEALAVPGSTDWGEAKTEVVQRIEAVVGACVARGADEKDALQAVAEALDAIRWDSADPGMQIVCWDMVLADALTRLGLSGPEQADGANRRPTH